MQSWTVCKTCGRVKDKKEMTNRGICFSCMSAPADPRSVESVVAHEQSQQSQSSESEPEHEAGSGNRRRRKPVDVVESSD